MAEYSERQWVPQRGLLCQGDEQHFSPLPNVRSCEGADADLRCVLCGSAMALVDVLTVESQATLGALSYRSDPPLYTTAKLHPLPLLAAMAAKEPHA